MVKMKWAKHVVILPPIMNRERLARF